MTVNDHPSYPFPSIREVVCEIHFQSASEWDASLYNKYFEQIKENFPTFEPVTLSVSIEFALAPLNEPGLVVPQVIRYKHASKNLFLQLSPNRLAINVLPPYPGWGQVLEYIRDSWDRLSRIVQPKEVTRLGLRYINGIERSVENEPLGRWLKPSEYIPSTILQSQPGLEANILTHLDSDNSIRVKLGDQPSIVNRFGTLIFDIDRISQRTTNPETTPVLEHATRLHNDVYHVFQSAINDDLEHLLKGELI